MIMSTRFRKIKYDGRTVLLTWTTEKISGESIEHTLTSPELPHPDFLAALKALALPACDICEIDEDYADKITVRGVTLSESDSGRRGCVVTMLRALDVSDAPLVLNTPHLMEDDGESERSILPEELRLGIERLEREADAFLSQAKRAQGDLFRAAEAEEPEPELAHV